MRILVLNSGSSSQKCCVYDVNDGLPVDPPAPVWQGQISWEGGAAEIRIRNSAGAEVRERIEALPRPKATERLLDNLWNGAAAATSGPSEIRVAGHRIVNGGTEYRAATFITPAVKAAISRMAALAPLHNRAELEGIDLVERKCGAIPQVGVFDTAFHSSLPAAASVYPGPYSWLEQGIRRLGFHGISHQYCAQRAARMLGKDVFALKIVTCHLGNGCSLAAIRDGQSVDTTMGFTPLEGLMMGTRSGSVDPGVLVYLLRQRAMTPEQLDHQLNHESGLLGISGLSSDMRQILTAMNQGHPRARLAFDIFVHRLTSGIGAMAAALGGLDALVFTGGIGEHSPEVRAAACASLEFLGVKIDSARNAHPALDADISSSDFPVRTLVVRAQEDWAIARECWAMVAAKGTPAGEARNSG